MKGRQGFTLMELLVVLLIIGILSTVALRTIDATRDRSLLDQTTAEMNKLIQAIVGNPDLAYDGRRVDFGYYGDMEQLPPGPTLRDLVYNSTGNMAWRGPYVKLMTAGDTISYLYDGWGEYYTYNPGAATINSEGGGKYTMTVNIVDDTAQLNNNTISGSFLDRDENPPGAAGNVYEVRLWYNNPVAHAGTAYAMVHPAPGGYYEIALHPSDTIWRSWRVPIGTKKLQAIIPSKETLTRYVAVAPRSHVVADFKFTRLFPSKLTIVGPPRVDGLRTGFVIDIANQGTENVSISSLKFLPTSASTYLRQYKIYVQPTQYLGPFDRGIGPGDSIGFPPVTIPPNMSQLVDLYLADFRTGTQAGDPSDFVNGKTFALRLSDGSKIEFAVP